LIVCVEGVSDQYEVQGSKVQGSVRCGQSGATRTLMSLSPHLAIDRGKVLEVIRARRLMQHREH